METNPYAPPKASIDATSATDLKRRSVVLMVVLTVVTLGLYYPIWFLRRRAALNRLDSPRKLRLWPFAVFTAWFVFQFVVGFATAFRSRGQVSGGEASLLFNLVQLGINILMLVQSFFTKDILEDHLSGPGDDVPNPLFVDSVKLSGVMTFLFQIFYLQYVINRYIAVPKSSAV